MRSTMLGDLLDVRLLGLDPQQVGAVLQRGDAVEHAAVLAGAGAELEEVDGRRFGRISLPLRLMMTSPFWRCRRVDFLAVEEAVVLVAQVARLVADGDLLGQARAQRVGAGDDDAVCRRPVRGRRSGRRGSSRGSTSCGTVTLPSWWPHCFSSETWFSICRAQAPASIIFLASR